MKAGEPIFYDKSNETVKFVSPVSGEVIEITRGEKRKILSIKIQADKDQKFVDHGDFKLDSANAEMLNLIYYLQDVGHLSSNVHMMLLQIQKEHQNQFLFQHMQLHL